MTTDADRAARERLAREARETATTLLDWVGTRVEGTRADGAGRPRQSAGPCSWCPVCALVAALRGEQPELTATLAEQASGLLVLLRMLVQAHASGSHDHHAPAPEPAPTSSSAAPAWPAEWGAPTWPADVPWDVAPHATFDPAPASRTTGRSMSPTTTVAGPAPDVPAGPSPEPVPDADPRPAERPTGRRGPRPSPRHNVAPAAAPAAASTAAASTAAGSTAAGSTAAGSTAAAPSAAADDVAPEPPVPAAATAPVVGNGNATRSGTRRGVQRITVRRRPRPC
ncbi:hypothetical protein [Actinomycetospora chiangmaiensis]|uniref:hypothetical protein n=1 Tax=Actinomycetospora chiangmaiensis TaxID=402650 RepID=UPI0003A1250E|nr:hypothetical protein [Actinomycetospora chiangmaiensis]